MIRVWVHRVSALDEAESSTGTIRTLHGRSIVPPDAPAYVEGDSLLWSPDAPGYGAAVLRGGLVEEVERWVTHPIMRVVGGLGARIEVV